MKRYLLTILMSLAMVFAIATMMGRTAYAEDITLNGIKYTDNGNRTASVTGCEDNLAGEVEIPAAVPFEWEDYPVTSIGEEAFQWRSLTSITIPAGVTSIGGNAFADCNNLTTVYFKGTKDQWDAINKGNNWDGGRSISVLCETTINGIKYTDNGNGTASVTGCEDNLTGKVEISATVTFDGAEYPVTNIGKAAFQGTAITSVTIPDSVTTIGQDSFKWTSLTSITIPASVTSIGEYAFYWCANLGTVAFAQGSKLDSIGEEAFQGTPITSITIPASVTSIGKDAFNGCSNLQAVTFAQESQLDSIGEGAFYGTPLTSITIPTSVTSIGGSAFGGCENLGTVTFAQGSKLDSIGDSAFRETPLTSISIPASVTSIGGAAFYGCSNLGTVTFAQGSKLDSIGGSAFQNTPLTSITIPASVTSIGVSAFAGCASFGTVTFAPGSKLVSIGAHAFRTTALTSITIPASVTKIGSWAFDCEKLTTVYYAGTQWDSVIDAWWAGGRDVSVVTVSGACDVPVGKTLIYNGKNQTGVQSGEGYTLINASATNAGSYQATAKLKEGYVWLDGKTEPKTISWKINKAANPLSIKAKTAKVKKAKVKKKAQTLAVSKVIAFANKGRGRLTYAKVSGNKKISINKTIGKVKVKKGLKKGTYKVKIKVRSAGDANYLASGWKVVTFKIRVR